MKRNVLYRNAVSGVEGTCSEEEFLELCKSEACLHKLIPFKYSDDPKTPPEAVKIEEVPNDEFREEEIKVSKK